MPWKAKYLAYRVSLPRHRPIEWVAHAGLREDLYGRCGRGCFNETDGLLGGFWAQYQTRNLDWAVRVNVIGALHADGSQ